MKDRGILGADGSHEIRILNRVITYHPAKPGCPEMLTYEADQRHANLLMAAYGLKASSKAKAIPWDKAAFLARHPLARPFLDEKRRVQFRSYCMRCLYLALDRPDIQFTAKEISRATASPTVHADETLKALSRYLAGHPRVLWRYTRQEWTGKVLELGSLSGDSQEYFGDLHHAGKHPIFAASSTQRILTLSSGEAEFYGAVRCACRTLGLKSLMSDLSLEVKAELVTDSSACKGLFSMCGAGKSRHIHCPALWLQHAVARRQIAIPRRAGKDLAPDVATKAGISEDTMWRLLGMFGLAKGEGRAKQALNMAGRQAEA